MISILKRNKQLKNNIDLYFTILCCIFLGNIYANFSNDSIKILVGYVTTLLILYKLIVYKLEDAYLLLFCTQFLRAVIRFRVGSSTFSFLILAFPIFFIKYFRKKNYHVSKAILIPILLLFWDIIVSINSSTFQFGDQILWGFSFILMSCILTDGNRIMLSKLIIVFGLAIWGICLVNIFAEIVKYGQTLVPSMYGTWNSFGEYYSFGKGYGEIAGGNEIAQYIPLFIGMSLLTFNYQPKSVKIFYAISIVFFLYCGVMCIARAFYIEMIIVALFYLLYLLKSPKRLLQVLALITIIILFFYQQFINEFNSVFNAVSVRFAAGYGGRARLIEETKEVWKSNYISYLFGIGTEYNMIYDTAHNIFYDSAISLGLLGLILYFTSICLIIFKGITKKARGCLYIYMPLIMLVVYKMISGCVKDVPFYFVISICIIFIKEYDLQKNINM